MISISRVKIAETEDASKREDPGQFQHSPSFPSPYLRSPTNLDQQEEVRVLTLGSGSVALPDVVVLNVNTHLISSSLCRISGKMIGREESTMRGYASNGGM